MAARGMVEIERDRCKGCLLCMEVCPRGVLGPDDEMNVKGLSARPDNTGGGEWKGMHGLCHVRRRLSRSGYRGVS